MRTSTSPATRTAALGASKIERLGLMPRPGDALLGEFRIPPARYAAKPLASGDLRRGWIVLSSLPNIHKRACSTQILDLEEKLIQFERRPRLVHVSADRSEERRVGKECRSRWS